ncbi:tetratricopeptide repeat protein [Polyangium sorediatum]|uniref:PEGA domain-containing protein n=1 Tax=Polyangium sorediatum TaxID=889274 RepID=A0ABT6NKQ6_9BACT|nr:hypothetical protein [Polyangium sorediatum]MDI1428889.1 hypothetical protein [Polyangium sorediatum]
MFRKSTGLSFFTAILLGAAHVSGQPSAADKAVADKLFDEGRALLDQNRLPEACLKFAESDRYDPSVGTRLNLGDCHERQGKTASAYGHFGEAARLARERGDKSRETVAEERRRALEQRLSRIQITASSSVTGLEVLLDGKVLGPAVFGTALPVDPGSHVVEARAPGRAGFHEEKVVPEGPATVEVVIPELAAVAPAAGKDVVAAPKSRWSLLRKAGLATGIAGVVGIGVGAGFGAAALQKNAASKEKCDAGDPTRCTQEGYTLRNEAGFSADVSTVLLGIGGGMLATGIVLFVVGGNEPEAPAERAWISPIVGRGSLGVSAGMEF